MSRAEKILSRFPAHFEAARPGKLLGDVTSALARDLDIQSSQIGAVRRAHRVREADTIADLMRIGNLHGIRLSEVDILTLRLSRAAELAEALRVAAPADRGAICTTLLELWALELPEDKLSAFAPAVLEGAAPPSPEEAETAAVDVLVAAVMDSAAYKARRQGISRRIIEICRNHSLGNGTVRSLLFGAANALDLDIQAVYHSEDRYVHAAEAFDLIPLVPGSGAPTPVRRLDVLGLEENPVRRASQAPAELKHAQVFDVLRKGFEPAALEISITPNADRGVGPMVVNRDQHRGVGYAGTIPPGETLVFSENGRARIGGADVTALAYGFDGALFADKDDPSDADLGFDVGTFVTVTPAGALDREATFPHAGLSVPMPEVSVGKTRMVFFVQEAHFGLAANPPTRPDDVITTPRPTAGFFSGEGAQLGSVFAPGPDEVRTPSALVSLAWQERQAYKVRVLVPARFRGLSEDPEAIDVARRVTDALERFRPVGIELETAFIDDRWILGDGVLAGDNTENNALLALSGGMVLWPSPVDDPIEEPVG